MRRFANALGACALATVLAGMAPGSAEAAPVIKLSPSSTVVGLSTPFSVDIIVEGLDDASGEAVGGFSALLSFGDSLISGVSYLLDPDDKMGAEVDASFGFAGGSGSPLDLFFVAEAGLDAAALSALQGTGFRLATISFTSGVLEGLTRLQLSVVLPGGTFLSDADGFDLPASAVGGSVCVSRSLEPCRTVPEPGLLSLLATGTLAAITARRHRRA